MGLYSNNNGALTPIAGRGRAEYGASTTRSGQVVFSSVTAGTYQTQTVTFDTPMPDADYLVADNCPDSLANAYVNISDKTVNGFKITITNNTGAVITSLAWKYTAFKLYTDTEYNELLNNQLYSTSEINTGKKWVDRKDIYRKVIDCGALPNATTKSVAHGITGYDNFVSISGFSRVADGSTQIPLPYVSPSGHNISVDMQGTNVVIGTDFDRTTYTNTYVILEYTKTTN